MAKWIALQARDGRRFDALFAAPESQADSNGRALIVLPEVYNINVFLRSVAARYADLGYTVLVPDLFWRQAPGRHYEYDEPEPARAQGAAVDVDAVVCDVGVAAQALRARLGEAAPVGVIGYCLGGRLSALAGARQAVDAVVSYYGVRLDAHLDELAGSRTPALYLFGGADPWVPSEVSDAIRSLAAHNDSVSVEVYAAAGHGFDRRGFAAHHADAAEAAQASVLEFFDRHLG